MWLASHLILHQECLGILLHKFKNQLVLFYEKFYWDLFGSAVTFYISWMVISSPQCRVGPASRGTSGVSLGDPILPQILKT